MERHIRVAIVRAAWLIVAGLIIAFLVPLVAGVWMVQRTPSFNEENLGEIMSGLSSVSEFQFWSALGGLGIAFVGVFWIAVVLSRWFAGRPETLASNGQSS